MEWNVFFIVICLILLAAYAIYKGYNVSLCKWFNAEKSNIKETVIPMSEEEMRNIVDKATEKSAEQLEILNNSKKDKNKYGV